MQMRDRERKGLGKRSDIGKGGREKIDKEDKKKRRDGKRNIWAKEECLVCVMITFSTCE